MARASNTKANSFKIGCVLTTYIIVTIKSKAASATFNIIFRMYLVSILFKSFF